MSIVNTTTLNVDRGTVGVTTLAVPDTDHIILAVVGMYGGDGITEFSFADGTSDEVSFTLLAQQGSSTRRMALYKAEPTGLPATDPTIRADPGAGINLLAGFYVLDSYDSVLASDGREVSWSTDYSGTLSCTGTGIMLAGCMSNRRDRIYYTACSDCSAMTTWTGTDSIQAWFQSLSISTIGSYAYGYTASGAGNGATAAWLISGSQNFEQSVAGTVSFSSTETFDIGKVIAGSLSFAGAMLKDSYETIAGVLSFTGSAWKGHFTTLAGTLQTTSSLLKETHKIVTGTLSFTGKFRQVLDILRILFVGAPSASVLLDESVEEDINKYENEPSADIILEDQYG